MSGIRLIETDAADIPTPPTDNATIFLDAATGQPSFKDDAGVVTSLEGIPGTGVPVGGTTGQVLAKDSGIDFDTSWQTVSGLTNPLTTTGDIIYSSSGTTAARLGIGSAGQVLQVTAGVPAWGAAGTGDVAGPASAVADRIVTFDSTTGKLIKDGGKTIADLRAPAVQSVTSSATVTPTFADDLVLVTAQAAALALANPTGTAIPGLGMAIRIKDNGTARAISYDTQYRAIGVTLPTTTVISKTLYLGMVFNSTDTKWDVVAVAQEA